MSAEATVSQNATQSDAHTRLHGRVLLLARVTWFAVVGLTVTLLVLSIPLQITQSQTICYNPDIRQCFQANQLTPENLRELQQFGLSLEFYAGYLSVVGVIFALVFLAVGALIFWRKSDDWIALLISLMLVIAGLANTNGTTRQLAPEYAAWTLPSLFLQFLGGSLLFFFFCLFPDGRFVPRWIRWLVPLVLAREGINAFLPDSELGGGSSGFVLFVIEFATALFAQIYRYRRISSPVQRQQTKWVVYGVAVALIGYSGLISILSFALPIWRTSAPAVMILQTLLPIFILLIPLSILIAVLRYGLYEIDVLINRTLVYVPLTAILAGVFAASITLSQKLSAALTGQQSDAATVLTTLIVVAVFEPLKSGLQLLVDKRFKEAPDPSKQLQAFGAQVQAVAQVMDSRRLTQRLLDEAMHAFGATSGAVYLGVGDAERLLHTSGVWKGDTALDVVMENAGRRIGRLALGPRPGGEEYGLPDRATLQNAANIVAETIQLTSDGSRDHL
jgi:hypothetical protein